MAELPIDDARALVRAIVDLSMMAQRVLPVDDDTLTAKVRRHLGHTGDLIPNTSTSFPSVERANLQLACDTLQTAADQWEVIGLTADLGNYGGVSLTSLVAGNARFPSLATARQYVTAAIGIDETVACLQAGLVLTSHEGHPLAFMHHVTDRGMSQALILEVVADDQAVADSFLTRMRQLMDEVNVMRGKVVSFAYESHGGYDITFSAVPAVARTDVVLPEHDLDAIERHAIGISRHRDALVAAGQHVKRGLLLYGPPGSGKTHTVSYLLNETAGRTTVILTGRALRGIGRAGAIARQLQPSTIVIEDVDLIATDRGFPGHDDNPVLFQLLNEMDGLAADADVLFILTTNRVDLLEQALAARPGRVDQAIEIGLPDADARRRLLALYVPAELDPAQLDAIVERTAGVTASFVKELGRRAVLASVQDGRPIADCVAGAVDALLDQSAPILRRTLASGIAD